MIRLLLSAVLFGLVVSPAAAESTDVTVRALANDAKLIPGVDVVIRDAASGDVMAEGVTEGGTGDTGKIVREPIERGAPVYATEGAAAFTATLNIGEPRRITVEATQAGTGAAASRTLWLIPGGSTGPNGILLTLDGLDVGVLEPSAMGVANGTFEVRAEVQMLCGCPVEPGGLWDANGFNVTAQLLRDGSVVADSVLAFTGKTSEFGGELAAPGPGEYELRVTAGQPSRGNYGVATRPLSVSNTE